jgi:hypothetical protein
MPRQVGMHARYASRMQAHRYNVLEISSVLEYSCTRLDTMYERDAPKFIFLSCNKYMGLPDRRAGSPGSPTTS